MLGCVEMTRTALFASVRNPTRSDLIIVPVSGKSRSMPASGLAKPRCSKYVEVALPTLFSSELWLPPVEKHLPAAPGLCYSQST